MWSGPPHPCRRVGHRIESTVSSVLPRLHLYAIFGEVQIRIWRILVSRGVGIAKEYRINQRIRVPEVRLIDEKGEQLGVMATSQAMSFADTRELDLVEVAPAAAPPVCRLMDYGRFKYETDRKERDERKKRKERVTNELREVRMKTRIGLHDRSAKTRLVKRLLGQGSKVKVSVMFRGREMDHPELGMGLLRAVAEDLVDDALLESSPRFEGRFLSMVLTPNLTAARAKEKELKVAEA